jgi:hypothetical protein
MSAFYPGQEDYLEKLNDLDAAAAAYVNAVRFDAAQSLTAPQKVNARSNIGLGANTPQDAGAAGDNVTTDTTNVQTAITNYGAVHFPKATGYKIGTISVGASKDLSGVGSAGPINLTGTSGIQLTGSGSTLCNLVIVGPGSAELISPTSGLSDITLDGLTLSSDGTAAPNGLGVHLNAGACHRWTLDNFHADTEDYPFLLNDGASGSTDITVSNSLFRTQKGDGFAVNTPTTAAENIAVAGVVVEVVAGSGAFEGFGYSFAHVDGASLVGVISKRSWLAARYCEDGSKNVTFIGDVAKNCQGDGVRVLYSGIGGNFSKAATVVGGHYESTVVRSGTAGAYIVNDGTGTTPGCSISNSVFRNFESGLWLGGGAIHRGDSNTIDGCTYAVRCETGNSSHTRITGSNMVLGACTALLYVSSGTGSMVKAGSFVCDTKPTNIILRAAPGVTRPGCSVDGFSWPQSQVLTAGVATFADLFPAPSTTHFKGVLTINARNVAGIADNASYSALVVWNGTALDFVGEGGEVNGAIAFAGGAVEGSVRVSGGQLQFGLFCASGVTVAIDVEFAGFYRD